MTSPLVAAEAAAMAKSSAYDALKPRILLLGASKSGKSSIERVVFHKVSPHETMFQEETMALDVRVVAHNPFVEFQIWDFPGDIDFKEPIRHGGETLTDADVFRGTGVVVFVIDAQDEPYTKAIDRLHDIALRASKVNSSLQFEVFIHKVDGDLFVSEDHKTDCQREIQQQIVEELADSSGLASIQFTFYLTSIFDHSIFEAFSRVVQKLIPQLPTLENLLNSFIAKSHVEKVFLFDVVSKVFLATDSNPVDERGYELCSDMIDVVIDVSCIYGRKDDGDSYESAYDSASSSVIRLTSGPYNGMCLYLREVTNYLALVSLVKAENFERKGLIDHNINVFKSALQEVFSTTGRRGGERVGGPHAGAGAGAGAPPTTDLDMLPDVAATSYASSYGGGFSRSLEASGADLGSR